MTLSLPPRPTEETSGASFNTSQDFLSAREYSSGKPLTWSTKRKNFPKSGGRMLFWDIELSWVVEVLPILYLLDSPKY